MTREEAYKLVQDLLPNKNLVKHCLAVEAIMRVLCRYLKGRTLKGPTLDSEFDEEEWGLVGLLHDADYEATNKDLERHTKVTIEKIKPMGASQRVIDGILAHHELMKPERENYLEKAIYASDELSGLITATALVKDKKLSNVTVETVMKKFKEKSFAAGAKREQILKCEEELDIPLKEFVEIALKAMQNISRELDL